MTGDPRQGQLVDLTKVGREGEDGILFQVGEKASGSRVGPRLTPGYPFVRERPRFLLGPTVPSLRPLRTTRFPRPFGDSCKVF